MRDEMRKARLAKGWSITDLAVRTGKSVSYLARIERGDRTGLPATLRRIEDVLGLEPLTLELTNTPMADEAEGAEASG